MNPHQIKLVLATGVLIWAGGTASAQSSDDWKVVKQTDRFDGGRTFFVKGGKIKNTRIVLSHTRIDCDNCSPRQFYRFDMSIFFPKRFECPTTDSIFPDGKVYVRWTIDRGPIHHQWFNLTKSAGQVSYLHQVLKVEPPGKIEAYKTFGSRDFRVLTQEQFVTMLKSGSTLYLRAEDLCGSSDVEFDLKGLKSAIADSKIDLLPKPPF